MGTDDMFPLALCHSHHTVCVTYFKPEVEQSDTLQETFHLTLCHAMNLQDFLLSHRVKTTDITCGGQETDKKENHSSFWNTVLTGRRTRLTGKLRQQRDLQTNDNAHICFHPDFRWDDGLWEEALCEDRHNEMDRRRIQEHRGRGWLKPQREAFSWHTRKTGADDER